jgi:transposase
VCCGWWGFFVFFVVVWGFGVVCFVCCLLCAKGIKPVAPFLHRFDNLYLFGAFSPITGESCLLELPHCNSTSFQVFINELSKKNPTEFKVVVLDNGAFHHARSLVIPDNVAFTFLPPYSPELNPAEKMWRYFKDRVSMIAYNNLEALQQQLSHITKQISFDLIKSICGNQFYKQTFRDAFNV